MFYTKKLLKISQETRWQILKRIITVMKIENFLLFVTPF